MYSVSGTLSHKVGEMLRHTPIQLLSIGLIATICFAITGCSGGTTGATATVVDDVVGSDPAPTTPPVTTGGVASESGGLIVIESESTVSSLGEWQYKTNIADYTGTSHLHFTGNKETNGNPNSPLQYQFRVNTAGVYQLTIRAAKTPSATAEHDWANDCYIRMAGDYTSADPNVPNSVLANDTKLFGANDRNWGGWSKKLDDHKNITGDKAEPTYNFKAGQIYTLTISGRSKNYHMDRIVIYDTSRYNHKDIDDPAIPASPTFKAGAPSGSG